MSGTILRRRDRTARPPRVEHYSSAVNTFPPTGNKLAGDYVYVFDFDGDKIRHMTKIWNDGHSLKQLGWA